ncbi:MULTISPECIES: serine protease [unclassified Streptomyces]|uniref:Serine protease n=1 Tax=Streptomyces sp. NBC_00060 TaxID=2975636 RepID=A0AAU2HAY5_9ACTN
MLRKVAVCAVAVLGSAALNVVPATAIVGGSPAAAQTASYQVSVRMEGWKGKSHVCGGFLLSANKVITAAHCVDGATASKLEVQWGGLDRNKLPQTSPVAKISVPPSYDYGTLANDVAVVTLAKSASETGGVKYARLATSEPAAGANVTVTGWGRTQRNSASLPTRLQTAKLPVLSRQSCAAAYSEPGAAFDTTGRFCAGPADGSRAICNGDAGGPAAINGAVVGIISGGSGCGETDSLSLFSSVSYFKSWLESQ